jgi:hypothetical protein
MRLTFDYGWYSDDLSDWPTRVEHTTIAGRRAKLGSVTQGKASPFRYSTALYIADPEPSPPPWSTQDDLYMDASCRSQADCVIAHQIFRSVRFKPKR